MGSWVWIKVQCKKIIHYSVLGMVHIVIAAVKRKLCLLTL